MIDANWDISRVQLSRRVCEGLKWRSRNGRLKEVNCRKVLSRLGREGKIRLPEAKRFGGNRKPRKEAEVVAAETVKSGDLKDFQPVDWMERRDTGKEFESGGGQQSLFNCAAVARAASGLARVRSGDERVKSGLERALRI